MAKIKYARIVFEDEKNLTRIVLIEDVKFQRADKECIKPKNEEDFIQGHKYYVKYYHCQISGDTCLEDHVHEFVYYGAYLYALGKSTKELEEKEKSERRKKFPNKKYMSSSSSTFSESSVNEVEEREKKKQAHKRVVRSERLEDVIREVKKKHNLYESFHDSSDESANGDENAASTPKKLCTDNDIPSTSGNTSTRLLHTVPSSSTTVLQEVTNFLGTQPYTLDDNETDTGNKNTNKTNRVRRLINSQTANEPSLTQNDQNNPDDHQNNAGAFTSTGNHQSSHPSTNEVRPVVDHDETPINEERHRLVVDHDSTPINQEGQAINNDDPANEAETSHIHCKEWIDNLIAEAFTHYKDGDGKEEYTKRYTIENGKTYLGQETAMEPIRWNILHSEKNPVKFVRALALIVWGPENLANRAVVLKKVTKKNRFPNASPVKELERHKLRLLISIFADYLRDKKYSTDQTIEYLRNTTSYLSKKINEMKHAIKKRNRRVQLRLEY